MILPPSGPNREGAVGNQNVEQFSVNVTITKVGNQLISSRVDSKLYVTMSFEPNWLLVSKQMMPEDIEDSPDGSGRVRMRSISHIDNFQHSGSFMQTPRQSHIQVSIPP
jgi:hypothetical protein